MSVEYYSRLQILWLTLQNKQLTKSAPNFVGDEGGISSGEIADLSIRQPGDALLLYCPENRCKNFRPPFFRICIKYGNKINEVTVTLHCQLAPADRVLIEEFLQRHER